MNKWRTWLLSGSAAALGGLLGFITSQSVAFYTFATTLETTKKIEMIHLTRELTKEWYSGDKDSDAYRRVRMAIERCQPLYRGYDKAGGFDNDEINRYLGFFDDLGFYYLEGALDLRFIAQEFGAYIIEAYEYPELRKYVHEIQTRAHQPEALKNFQEVAKLIEMQPSWRDQIEFTKRACQADK